VWYVSQVEKNIGKHGINAVRTPAGLVPNPILAVSSRLARVQFNESMPWLSSCQHHRAHAIRNVNTDSKSSPSGELEPVRLACFPSILSIVEYAHNPNANE